MSPQDLLSERPTRRREGEWLGCLPEKWSVSAFQLGRKAGREGMEPLEVVECQMPTTKSHHAWRLDRAQFPAPHSVSWIPAGGGRPQKPLTMHTPYSAYVK